MNDRRFWLVWRDGGSVPTTKHPTCAAATAEANRLSMHHPGVRFVVLEAVAEVIGTVSVATTSLDPIGVMQRAPIMTEPDILGPPARSTCWPPWPKTDVTYRTPGQLGDPPPGAAYDYRPISPSASAGGP